MINETIDLINLNVYNKYLMSQVTMLWINLINYIAFYIGWMLLVVYGNNMVTLLIVYGYLLLHITLAKKKLTEFITIIAIGLIGFILETTLLNLKVYAFQSNTHICPLWFYSLWLLFGSTFNFCLKKIEKYPAWLIGPIAGIVAAFSYYAGARLNHSFILPPPIIFSLLIISLTWMIIFPFLQKMVQRLRTISSKSQNYKVS